MPVELSESKLDDSLKQTDAGFWPKLEARFRKLQAEADENQRRGKCSLTASWFSTRGDQGGEHWDLNGATKRIRTQYGWLAESAAVRLGHARGPSALSFWLNLLKAESPDYSGGGLGTSTQEGIRTDYEVGTLEHLCEASAEYCLKCETQEIAEKQVQHAPPEERSSGLRKKQHPKGFDGLQPKQDIATLRKMCDQAGLTEQQEKCVVLRWGYTTSVSETAKRLLLDRKTVQDHLARAKIKLDRITAPKNPKQKISHNDLDPEKLLNIKLDDGDEGD